MAIENRNLEAGTKLIARYKKQEYRAEVIAGEGDKIMYRLNDGRQFKSPSAAGTAITGEACNGWAFWSVEPDSSHTEPDGAETLEQASATVFRRVPNQKGVEEGEVRLYCDACQKSFNVRADQQPENCPQGHTPDGGHHEVSEA